jgi:hypothetical protein
LPLIPGDEWLVRFIEHRIGDRRIIRLIQKWLKAGVLKEDQLIETTEGTPQGSDRSQAEGPRPRRPHAGAGTRAPAAEGE